MNVLAEIRNSYIRENPKRFEDGPTLIELAARYDVSYETVRRQADKEDWYSKRQNYVDTYRANSEEFGDETLVPLVTPEQVNITDAASEAIADMINELRQSIQPITKRLREVFSDTNVDQDGKPNISPSLLLEYSKLLFNKQKYLIDMSIKLKQASESDSKEISALIRDIQEGADLIRVARGDDKASQSRKEAVASWGS